VRVHVGLSGYEAVCRVSILQDHYEQEEST